MRPSKRFITKVEDETVLIITFWFVSTAIAVAAIALETWRGITIWSKVSLIDVVWKSKEEMNGCGSLIVTLMSSGLKGSKDR